MCLTLPRVITISAIDSPHEVTPEATRVPTPGTCTASLARIDARRSLSLDLQKSPNDRASYVVPDLFHSLAELEEEEEEEEEEVAACNETAVGETASVVDIAFGASPPATPFKPPTSAWDVK